ASRRTSSSRRPWPSGTKVVLAVDDWCDWIQWVDFPPAGGERSHGKSTVPTGETRIYVTDGECWRSLAEPAQARCAAPYYVPTNEIACQKLAGVEGSFSAFPVKATHVNHMRVGRTLPILLSLCFSCAPKRGGADPASSNTPRQAQSTDAFTVAAYYWPGYH